MRATHDRSQVKGAQNLHGKAVQRTAERAKLPDATPVALRHTARRWMAERVEPLVKISRYMGHSSTKITERHHARFNPDYRADAARALELQGS